MEKIATSIKHITLLLLLAVFVCLTDSCSKMNAVEKTDDYEYKYEVAKQYFVEGKYSQASVLFGEVLATMKGTANAEESLYITAMSYYCHKDHESASQYFRKYYQMYPKGLYVEYARYFCGLSLYKMTVDPRLDQSATYSAIQEFTEFLDLYPRTKIKNSCQDMIYSLNDKLVQKEYLSAKMYYDLGNYMGNCTSGGSNYEASIVTAQNALHDFPYAQPEHRENLSIMILRARYHLAQQSVQDKRLERYRDCVDEYYAFKNDYPESKYLNEAQNIFTKADAYVKSHGKN